MTTSDSVDDATYITKWLVNLCANYDTHCIPIDWEVGKEKIRGYYDMILNAFLLGQQYLETSFGKTLILEAGKSDSPPLVLLHGSCSISTAWLGDFSSLRRQYHFSSVDIPGEPGNSEEYRFNLQSEEYSRWLEEVQALILLATASLVPPKQAFIEQTEIIRMDQSGTREANDTIPGDAFCPRKRC